jgi:hypothetical protein
MSNLKDLIQLAKADGGKFFVMDEEGNASLVIMSVEEYQKMLLGKLQKQVFDVENINREIFKAQILENEKIANVEPVVQKRAVAVQPDLRSEVIDPSFDFEAPNFDGEDF